ncbi:MAG: hypothetical protein KME22_25455 [Hassallia sp. WJT32-NPBG1]|jgi:hypothetical protein|nr:hypothetical protein [Hassallia sp. WJT32-NPBG1]
MSRIKIDNLSFCESQLPSNSQVQGGLSLSEFLSRFLSAEKYELVSITKPVDGEYETKYFAGKISGSEGYISSGKNFLSGIKLQKVGNSVYTHSFTMAGNLDLFTST